VKLDIRSVERGICPIVTLYSLAAAYKRSRCKKGRNYLPRGQSCSQFCPKIRCAKIRCHGKRGRQRRNLNDTIRQPGAENRG